jgi:signal transduction histidine kinase
MIRKAFLIAFRHPTSWIFLFSLAAGLVMAIARAEPALSTRELAALISLSLVYLFTGTVIFLQVLTSGSPAQKMIYLAFQICLGMLILYLGRGNGWLVMLPLASHSVALFSPREAVIPCVLITLGIAWETSRMVPNWIPLLQSAVVFGSAVFFAAVFTDISIRDTRRKEEVERLAARLEEANRQLQEYASKVEQLSIAQERNQLAREIHDGLGHYLTALNIQANVVGALIEKDPDQAALALEKMQFMIREALADVRRSVAALRSEELLGKNLLDAVGSVLDESRAAGLAVDLVVNGEVRRLPVPVELTLYRAVQEGLTNVRKHAQSERAIVLLYYRPGEVGLRIQDDGVGSELGMKDLDLLKTSFGLFGLRERVQLLGGSLNIKTAPGQGFCLEINLPEG